MRYVENQPLIEGDGSLPYSNGCQFILLDYVWWNNRINSNMEMMVSLMILWTLNHTRMKFQSPFYDIIRLQWFIQYISFGQFVMASHCSFIAYL